MSFARKIKRNKQVQADKPYRCCKKLMLAKPWYEKDGCVLYVCQVCFKTKYLPLREGGVMELTEIVGIM